MTELNNESLTISFTSFPVAVLGNPEAVVVEKKLLVSRQVQSGMTTYLLPFYGQIFINKAAKW